MVMTSYADNCTFCTKFGTAPRSDREWYDEVLTSLKEFKVVPGLGPFSEGYLLIVTTHHYLNTACLPQRKLNDLRTLKRKVRDVLTRHYEPPIFFEHGPRPPGGGGGSCIDHAHLHAFPTSLNLLPHLQQSHHIMPIDNLTDLTQFCDHRQSYLFFEDQEGQMYACSVEEVPSQYIRRIMAREMGKPNEWDYALFPNYDLIDATINQLTPWPG